MTCRQMTHAVDKSLLSKLRKTTGYSLMNCKKALEKCENNIDQAEKWLSELAQKEGWAKASKLQGRPMSQGLIGLIHDKSSATILEVNCETDFVARNDKFKSLVTQVTHILHTNFSSGDRKKVGLDASALSSIPAEGGKILADIVAVHVGNIGENMALRRASYLRADTSSVIGTYVHSSGEKFEVDNCKLGRYGAIVEVGQAGEVREDILPLDVVALKVSQHIVGSNPRKIGSSEDKPEEDKDNETKLLFQELVMDPDMTVKEFLENNSAVVKDFVRIECGEELEEKNSDK
ncbi:hypothetical protein ACJMK2_013876 [Sinanodonta woodiana]